MIGTGEPGLLHQLNGMRRLPTRVSTAQWALLGLMPEAGRVTPFGGDAMVRTDAWKIVTDGSKPGSVRLLEQPYLEENRWARQHDTGGSARAGQCRPRRGWQLMVHANGDAAVEFALEAHEVGPQGSSSN